MKSIRNDLTNRLLSGCAILIVVASAVLGIGVHSRIVGEFDRTLESKALALIALISRERNYIEVDYSEDEMPVSENEEDLAYFQVFFEDGTLIESSEDVADQALPVNWESSDGFHFRNFELPDARRGRLVQIGFVPRFDAEDDSFAEGQSLDEDEEEDLVEIPDTIDPRTARITLVVARNRERLDQLIFWLYGALAAVDSVLLLGIAFVTKKSIRKGLEPIDQLNAQIRTIDPEATDQKISLENAPEELQTIINALNHLLVNIQSAFDRERRFSNAVAHELRTPVAELRMSCEAGQRWPDDSESVKQFFQDNHEIALHMERIVTNLLQLTRCHDKTSIVDLEELFIDSLVRDCWERTSEVANRKELKLDDRINPVEKVISDKAKLEIILQNIIDNAVSYSVSGSVVVFSSSNEDGTLTLVFENETNNISDEDLEHLFERFWRKDPARSADSHTGLGLALVKALSDLLNIEASIALPDKNTFQVRLTFSNQ